MVQKCLQSRFIVKLEVADCINISHLKPCRETNTSHVRTEAAMRRAVQSFLRNVDKLGSLNTVLFKSHRHRKLKVAWNVTYCVPVETLIVIV
jgi:hypothetical protein